MICSICPHRCDLSVESKCGIISKNGKIIDNFKGLFSTLAIDSIEKRPFFHFAPGRKFASVGMYSCSFHCSHCLNKEISQEIKNIPISCCYDAKGLVQFAEINKASGIVFSYNEPTIYYEYLREVGYEACFNPEVLLAIKTNGFISLEPLRELTFLYDAFNVDIKGDEEIYEKYCGGSFEPVKKSIELIVSSGNWLEISYLVMSSMVRNNKWNNEVAEWLSSLNKNIPVHLLYFYSPELKYDRYELFNVRNIFMRHLNYVYISNVYNDDFITFRNTYCSKCGREMITRNKETTINYTECCGRKIEGLLI